MTLVFLEAIIIIRSYLKILYSFILKIFVFDYVTVFMSKF